MTLKKQHPVENVRESRKSRHTENHLAEKHYKNAFRNQGLNLLALPDEDLSELGFDDDQTDVDFL